MGDARRRKLLDPNWGRPKIHTLAINKRNLRIEQRIFKGFLTLQDNEKCTLEIDCTNNEIDLLENVLANTLSTLLEQFNFQKIKYRLIFDISNLLSKNGVLHIYPAFWEIHQKERRYKVAMIELKRVTETEEERSTIERPTPAEHIRRAHKRRVAYGKNRAFRKWVDIPETVVNAR